MMKYFITNMSFNLLVKEFLIGEHLAKLQSEWLIVSYTPFALDVADATRVQYCHMAQDHSMQTRRWPI